MSSRKKVIIPLNRVEGDLKIHLEYDGNTIYDAFSAGTMYRGFENIMKERGPLDGLVITPRICGICSNSHLSAAAKALDMISHAVVPDNATRVRNITLIAEQLQNDVRHHILQFMVDSVGPAYESSALFEESVFRYTPMKGNSIIEAIKNTKKSPGNSCNFRAANGLTLPSWSLAAWFLYQAPMTLSNASIF